MCDGAGYLLTGGVRLVCVSDSPTSPCGALAIAWAIAGRMPDAEWRG